MKRSVLGALLLLAGCAPADVGNRATEAASPLRSTSVALSHCLTAFGDAAAAKGQADADVALDRAILACGSRDAWIEAASQHPEGLGGREPEQMLLDRCLQGPPDLAASTLCQELTVDR